jgi:hypothetical protein
MTIINVILKSLTFPKKKILFNKNMKTSTILTISGLSLIFTSVLTWITYKKLGPKGRKMTFTITNMLFFVGFVLIGVSQLLGYKEGYRSASPASPVPISCECGSSSKKCKPACPGSGKYCAGKNAYTPPFISDWQTCTQNSECDTCKPVEQIAVFTMATPPYKRLIFDPSPRHV